MTGFALNIITFIINHVRNKFICQQELGLMHPYHSIICFFKHYLIFILKTHTFHFAVILDNKISTCMSTFQREYILLMNFMLNILFFKLKILIIFMSYSTKKLMVKIVVRISIVDLKSI
ncbi:hypothetical protein ACJX0J_013385 [Zea mays]